MHACDSPQSCLTLCNPMDCSLPVSSIHGDFPGKNTGVGCHALLQVIFLTQGLDPGLFCPLNWQVGSSLAPPRKSHFSHKYSHNVISHFTCFFIFNVTFHLLYQMLKYSPLPLAGLVTSLINRVMVWDYEGSGKANALPSGSLRILTLGEGSCPVQNLTLLRLTWWICCTLQRVAMINVQPWEWVKWDNHFILSLWMTRGPSETFPNSCACVLSCFSHACVCVALWAAACQAPLSIGFSRQKY